MLSKPSKAKSWRAEREEENGPQLFQHINYPIDNELIIERESVRFDFAMASTANTRIICI